MSALILNDKFEKQDELALPANFIGINKHNLYLYVKSYRAFLRENSAHTKTRSEVSGGGKKPWKQKGRGGSRAGSNRSPIWTGGGVAFGPRNNKNYVQKINKKQKKLALKCALEVQAKAGNLFIVNNVTFDGKIKQAAQFIKKLDVRNVLVVKELIDDKTFLSFRNLKNAYLIEENELNAFLATTFRAVVIEKAVWENLTKEG